jgi:hypothetical protein
LQFPASPAQFQGHDNDGFGTRRDVPPNAKRRRLPAKSFYQFLNKKLICHFYFNDVNTFAKFIKV